MGKVPYMVIFPDGFPTVQTGYESDPCSNENSAALGTCVAFAEQTVGQQGDRH